MLRPSMSTTEMLTVCLVATKGVPEITPVELLKVRPLGKVPEKINQV